MLATIVITALLALAVALAIRSIVRSRTSGGCSACDNASACSACKGCDICDITDGAVEQTSLPARRTHSVPFER